MNLSKALLPLLIILSATVAQAQRFQEQPFDNPDSLLVDIQRVLANSSSKTADTVSAVFSETFESLTEEQQTKIFQLSQNMYRKGYRANPYLEDLYASIAFGISFRELPSEQIDRFLQIADTTVNYYQRQVLPQFLKLSRAFCTSDTIYTSRYNTLVLTGGKFSFAHEIDENLYQGGEVLVADVVEELPEEELSEEEKEKEEWFDHLEEEKSKEGDPSLDDWGAAADDDDGWGDSSADGWGDSADDGWATAEDGWETSDEGWVEDEPVGEDGLEPVEEESPLGTFVFSPTVDELPAETGPMIHVEEADMMLASIYDTAILHQATGSLLMKDYMFVGQKGRMNWSNLGLNAEEVYCDLNGYAFNIKTTRVKAEDADLYYKSKLDSAIKGVFVYDSHFHNKDPKDATFPQFQSYYNNIELDNLADSIYYRGGFSLKGRKFYSNSLEGGDAEIQFVGQDGPRFTSLSSKGFSLIDSALYSPQASIEVHYNAEQSLSHPAVILKYDARENLLRARKDKSEYKISPFEDTRQNVNIDAEMLEWDLNKDSIDIFILNARQEIPLVVESKDYFDKYRFIALQGLYSFHPLQMVVGYANRIKENTFSSYEMAKTLDLNPKVVRGAMVELGRRGYIDYDPMSDEITVLRKAKLYVYANMGKKGVDFDNMIMHSRVTNGPNLSIYVKGSDFKLSGVSQFKISDKMNINATPANGKVNLKEGRNTSFAGEMRAGNFVFRGKEFEFNYDSFKVNLDVVDSISIIVKDKKGRMREMENNIVNTGGVLYISHPRNKSGQQELPQYPVLDALKGGTILFDGPEILGGAYDDRIRFEIPPFNIDSLNSNNTNIIAFDGTFKSGGIFEDLQETIKVDTSDFSFGFIREMPDGGAPIYGGKGKFYNKIRLNNKGIRGAGDVEYLTANFKSEDFIFYSDSVLTKGKEGEIAFGEHDGIEFPSVKMEDYKMRWLVNSDSMFLTNSKDKPFEIYDPETTFEGELMLSPLQLAGNGKVETTNSINESEHFYLSGTSYISNYSTFQIKSDDPKTPAMLGDPVEVKYDLKERIAEITSEEEGESVFDFPFVKYQSSISKVEWNLDKDLLSMSVNTANDEGLGRFVSGNRKQDSLAVFASNAVYDLKGHILGLQGVPNIIVANTRIIPDSGLVNIRRDAEMDALENAVIEMNAYQKRHVLHNAFVKINSRTDFEATGIYRYGLGVKDTFDITFSNFKIEKVGDNKKKEEFRTTTAAEVMEEENFVFAPGLKFKGKMELVDNEEYPHFDGQVSLNLDREANEWFAYSSTDASNHGVIQVDENLQVAGYPTKLKTGIYLSRIDREPYVTMLEFMPEWSADKAIFQARGELIYSDSTQNYTVAPRNKLNDETLAGQKYVYNHQMQMASFEGLLDLVQPAEELYTVKAAGSGTADFGNKTYDLNTAILIEFAGDGPTMDVLAEDIKDNVYELGGSVTDEKTSSFQTNIAQLIPERQFFEFLDRFSDGSATLADYFNTGIFISDVDLKWSDETRAFYSVGNIGLGSIFKTETDVMMEGYLEIPKAESEQAMTLFLMEGPQLWYYFQFDKTGIRAISSNDIFNMDLQSKGNTGIVQAAQMDEMLGFVSSFRMNYLGIEEMLDLVLPTGNIDPYADSPGFSDDPFGDIPAGDAPLPADEPAAEEEEDDDGF